MKGVFQAPVVRRQMAMAVIDSLLVFLAIIMAYAFRLAFVVGAPLEDIRIEITGRMTWFVACAIVIHLLVFYVFQLYELKREYLGGRLFVLACAAVVVGALVLSVVVFIFPFVQFGRIVMVTHVLLTIVLVYGWRWLLAPWLFLARLRSEIAFIGDDESLQLLHGELSSHPIEMPQIRCALRVDDGEPPEVEGVALCHDDAEFDAFLERADSPIDTVVLSGRTRLEGDSLRQLLMRQFSGLAVHDLPSYFAYLTGRLPVSVLSDAWLLSATQHQDLRYITVSRIKRLMDLCVAVFGLFCAAPFFVVIPILIKLESKGPVFFGQERQGRLGQPFRVYKFRTMKPGSESPAGGDRVKVGGDPRITRVGKILRSTHLDEIPQIFNILRGDMSLVGPRPIRKVYTDKHTKESALYPLRLSVKPGLTGWAQVQKDHAKFRDNEMRRLEYDLYYIQRASLFLDLVIVVKTVTAVLFGRGG